ncbi:uncharacterized protein LOC135470949 [Liolophura sinensis]|uniref:uncharacterized protein LOC135470949 n=1 Tax=Liolophura sinensis TaxID=3198878 RepID=UPI003159534C
MVEIDYTDEQMRYMLQVLTGTGLLVASEKSRSHCEGLALPNFRSLIVTSQYYCPLSDKLPDCKPQLHWTPKPFKGDIQVGWRYKFLSGVPPLLMKRMMAVCRSASPDANYLHCWKFGVLLRMDEVIICLTEEGQHFDICCRVNADDPGREDEAVQLIWAHLSPLLKSMSYLLASWRGLFTEIFLIPLGSQLFGGEKVEGETGLALLECLINWEKGENICPREGENVPVLDLDLLFPFKDKQTYDSVDAFIDFLLANRPKILSTLKPTPPYPRGLPVMTKIDTRPRKQRSSKKKKAEIKWDLSDSKSKADPVRNVSVTKASEESSKPAVQTAPPAEHKPPSPKPKAKGETEQETKSVDINANSKDGNTTTPMTGTGRFLNEEDEIKEANRVASGFVAAVMATAVAEFIASEFNDNHSYKQVTTAAQVAAAKMTAEAAMAAQTGDIDGAARAVIAAAQAVEKVLASPGSGLEKHGAKSKVCAIL